MSFQRVRALVPVRHDGVLRIPGVTTGENAQDFVVRVAQAARMIELGLVAFIEAAEPPATGLEQVFVDSGGTLRRPGGGAIGGGGGASANTVTANGAEYAKNDFFRTLEKVGFTGSSSVRQDGFLQEAIARYEFNGGGRLELPPELAGKTIRMDGELVIDVSKTTFIGAGNVFDHSNQSSGNALSIRGFTGDQNAVITRHATQFISGIRWFTNNQPGLIGLGAAAGGSAGSGRKFGFLLDTCAWVGFHTSYEHDQFMWANTFRHCAWWPALSGGGNTSRVLNFSNASNVGERVQLHDCTATNGGIFIDLNAPNVDVHLNGVSIDDFDTHINASTGRVFGTNLHIENGKSTDHWIKLSGTNTAVHLDVLEFIIRSGLTMNYELASVADTCKHGGLIVGQTHISVGGTYNFPTYVTGGGRAKLGELTELDSQSRTPWSRWMNKVRPLDDANSVSEWMLGNQVQVTTNNLTLPQVAAGNGVKISSASAYFDPRDTGTRIQDAGTGAAIITAVLDSQNVIADIVSAFSNTTVAAWRHYTPRNTGAPVRDTVTTFNSSPGSIKFVVEQAAEAFAEQYINISGGKTVRGSYRFRRLNCQGGAKNLSVLVNWCDKNRRIIGSTQTLAQHTGADQDWTLARFGLSSAQVPPEGAEFARVRFYVAATTYGTGEVWVDDVVINTI